MVKCSSCGKVIPSTWTVCPFCGHGLGSSKPEEGIGPFSLESIGEAFKSGVPDNIPDAIRDRDWPYLLVNALPRLCYTVEYMEGAGKIAPREAANIRAWINEAFKIITYYTKGFSDDEIEKAMRSHFTRFPIPKVLT
jgi:hypothetical protein